MKALLIGGTGTISLSISKLLIKQGWELYLLNRGNRPLPKGAKSIVADINDEAAVTELMAQHHFDVVADFIAFTPSQLERDFRLFEGKTRQFVFVSSASAYQKPLSRLPITESTPLANPYWQYSRDKIACEELLLRLYREKGFPVTIVRPSHTYDKTRIPVGLHGGSSWQVVSRIKRGKPVIVHGDGSSLWTFTHARDFAKGFAGLMGNPHAIGEAVHITSDESVSWNAAYTTIAHALGVELNPVHVPSWLIASAGKAHGYDFEGGLLGDKAVSVVFDNSKIKRLVPGFVCATRFDEGVREALEYLQANPELQQEDAAFEAFCDELAGKIQRLV